MDLGKVIKNIRISNNIARSDLANKIEISSSYLGQIENGTIPSLNVISKISKFFNVPLSVLLWFTIEESDIPKAKKEIFRLFYKPITSMMEELINTEQKKINFNE